MVGGGTGGHVVPALAVSTELKRRGAEILFIGSQKPEDRKLAEAAGFPFEAVSAGKFRRYFSWRTLFEPFKSQAGYRQAKGIIERFKPDVVLAKGGYVAVPVIRAAKKLGIPIVLHESDVVPGLANKIGSRYAQVIAVSFPPEAMAWKTKVPQTLTGNPIGDAMTKGRVTQARQDFGLSGREPVLLVLGGSQGSVDVNEVVFAALPELLGEIQVVHQVGTRSEAAARSVQREFSDAQEARYHPQGYFDNTEELPNLLATADLVVTRAGAGSLAGIAAAGKPSIIIPLPSSASNHQQANAAVFQQAGAALVLPQDGLTPGELARAIKRLLHDPTRRSRMARVAKALAHPNATKRVADLVEQTARRSDA